MALTKADMAENLFLRMGLNKLEANDLVEAFFDEISQSLASGEAVKLSGFGNFQLLDKPARPGRNPKTGDRVIIDARRVATFRAGNKLRDRVDAAHRARAAEAADV
ncbi:MAG: integration host factor subunit alpha [Pseudomonadota bacterium]